MSHSFGMQVLMKAVAGRGDDLARIMLEASAIIKRQPGCQNYIVFKGMSNPEHVMITEVWDHQQAHQTSHSNPQIKSMLNTARPLIAHMEHQVGRPMKTPFKEHTPDVFI